MSDTVGLLYDTILPHWPEELGKAILDGQEIVGSVRSFTVIRMVHEFDLPELSVTRQPTKVEPSGNWLPEAPPWYLTREEMPQLSLAEGVL